MNSGYLQCTFVKGTGHLIEVKTIEKPSLVLLLLAAYLGWSFLIGCSLRSLAVFKQFEGDRKAGKPR